MRKTAHPSRSLTRLLVSILAISMVAPAAPAHAKTPQSTAEKFSRGDELVQLDFKDVELTVVIETIARITGHNFIYDDRVRGRVTIISPSEVTVDQAYSVFEAVLKIKGFTAVPGPGGITKIVPVREAKESSIETIKDGRPPSDRDQFVTRLVPLLYIDAEAITTTIRPLVSKNASMVAYPPTNTIIMTDTEANIRRLLSILEAIDVKSHKEELAVIKVKYADAATLGEQISQIYQADVSSTSTATAAARRARTVRRPPSPSLPTRAAGQRAQVRIITDDRTNSLLVLASRKQLQDVRKLVKQLDVPLIGGGRIRVYYLRNADAEEMAGTLNGMLSGKTGAPTPGRTGPAALQAQSLRSAVTELAQGITLNADPATNSLVIQASKEAYETLVSVIEQLDIPRPQVLVEALILEVDITDNQDLGIELGYQAVNGDRDLLINTAEAVASSGTAGAFTSFLKRSIQRDPTTGMPVAGQRASDISAVLKAAAKDSNLNVVSAPHILTSDNEEAEIRIGNNIPIITSRVNSATGNTAGLASSVNVERQDIGVTLRVTPQISEGDTLRMKIYQEITDVNGDIAVGPPEEVGVALFNRKIENTVVVRDGEMVVVGGLISNRWSHSVSKVPFLGDIPILGWAFKSTSKELRKINLLVFLTPHIVRNGNEMALETIRKREEFESSGGENYETEEPTGEEPEKNVENPVVDRLREHARRYPPARREKLEQMRADAERQREAERLDSKASHALVYKLRVALYHDEGRATQDLTRLLDAGYDGSLLSGQTDGELFHELIVGPFEDLQAAEDAAHSLDEVYGYTPRVLVNEASTERSPTSEHP